MTIIKLIKDYIKDGFIPIGYEDDGQGCGW